MASPSGPLQEWTTMGDLFVQAVRRFGDREAMVDDRGSVTYRQLGDRVSRVARVLAAHGLRRGDGLAQLGGNSIASWVVQMATYTLGARFVGLHALGSLDDQAFMVTDSGATMLVVDADRHPDRLTALVDAVDAVGGSSGLERVLVHGAPPPDVDAVDLWREAGTLEPAPLEVHATGTDLARLAYTGGTTGRPKGVMLPHRCLVMNTLIGMAGMEWPRPLRFVAAGPITHGAGSHVLPVLLQGGTMVLLDHFTPDALLDAVEVGRATAATVVPTMLYALLDHPRTRQADLSSLQLLHYAASPASPARLAEALDVVGPVLVQAYGQTEAPNTITVLAPEEHDGDRLASVGRPCPGVTVAVLDDAGRPVPPGRSGEICVRGPLVMDGYWNRPEETAKAFEHGWLHTGDVAYEDEDGFLYIVDRKKDVIISGGFNVYPREVEDVLTSHPAVAAAVVVGVPDERWGEAVKGVVVPRSGRQVDEAELIALVRDRKGAVHAPKSIDVVEAIPLTAVGKPDKKAVRSWYWQGQERNVH